MRHLFPFVVTAVSFAAIVRAANPQAPVNLAGTKDLPEGQGFAGAFVADVKLRTHAEVLFADDFETGSLGAGWDEAGNKEGKV